MRIDLPDNTLPAVAYACIGIGAVAGLIAGFQGGGIGGSILGAIIGGGIGLCVAGVVIFVLVVAMESWNELVAARFMPVLVIGGGVLILYLIYALWGVGN